MAYIKFNKEESEKFLNIPKVTLETFTEDETVKINEDGTVEIDEDMVDILEDIAEETSHNIYEESELPEKVKDGLLGLMKTYSEDDGDINLKTPIALASRGSNVISFYIYNNWLYLLDDDGADIDPNDVEVEFLEKFIDYVSDTNNTEKEED